MAAIIFDFDGTIADSFDYVADFLIRSSARAPLSDEERRELRGHSMVAMARKLGHPWWRLPRLFLQGRRRMNHVIRQLYPFEGMSELIRKLHAEGHELFIVSSNSVHNVHSFLHHHNLHTFFLEIYGGIGLFGKAPALRKLKNEHGFETSQCVYIGDELRDVEAAQSLKMKSIAVAWGFARSSDLKALKPTAFVSSTDELMKVLEEV